MKNILCKGFWGGLLLLLTLSASAQWNTYNMLQMGKNAIYFDDYVSAIDNFNNIIRINLIFQNPIFSEDWQR